MGCTQSAPRPHDEEVTANVKAGPPATDKGEKAVAQNPTSTPKSKSTRARRLSYVTNQDAEGAKKNELTQVVQKNSGTRVRRLSYVSNEKDGGDKIKAELGAGEECEQADYDAAADMVDNVKDGDDNRPVGVKVACMSRGGREPGFKKTNQDNCFAFEKYITGDQSLFGAMDGHGPNGHLVSNFVKQHLPILLVNYLAQDPDLCKALSQGFTEVDRALGTSRIDCEFSGSTCVVTHLQGTTLTTAWVGDSRGVLGRGRPGGKKGCEAIELTQDHKPTTPEERARILKANGRVERLVDEYGQPMGPHRVWLQYAWIPGLAMSRALGDVLAHQVGVSSEPGHTVVEVVPEDRFLILASDGVWEFISNQEAVDIVAQHESPEEGCRQLIDEAYQRWLSEEEGVVDDITAVIVKLVHRQPQ